MSPKVNTKQTCLNRTNSKVWRKDFPVQTINKSDYKNAKLRLMVTSYKGEVLKEYMDHFPSSPFDLVQLSENGVDHSNGVRGLCPRLAGTPSCCQTLHLPTMNIFTKEQPWSHQREIIRYRTFTRQPSCWSKNLKQTYEGVYIIIGF